MFSFSKQLYPDEYNEKSIRLAIDAMRNEKQEHYIFNPQRYWERPEWSNLIKLDNDKWNNQKLIKHFEIETRSEELLFLSL